MREVEPEAWDEAVRQGRVYRLGLPGIRLGAWGCRLPLVIAAGLIGLATLSPWLAAVVCLLAVAGLLAYLTVSSRNRIAVLTDHGLWLRGSTGRVRSLAWSEVTDVMWALDEGSGPGVKCVITALDATGRPFAVSSNGREGQMREMLQVIVDRAALVSVVQPAPQSKWSRFAVGRLEFAAWGRAGTSPAEYGLEEHGAQIKPHSDQPLAAKAPPPPPNWGSVPPPLQ